MATRRLFRALAQQSYSTPRPAVGPNANPSSICGVEIRTKPCYLPFAAKCSTRYFYSCPTVNAVSSLFRRYLATSSTGAADRDAESASKAEVDDLKGVGKKANTAGKKGAHKGTNIDSGVNARVYRASLNAREVKDADEIGYSIVGPAKPGEFPMKPKDQIFAVIQVGAHQFKVCGGDRIVVEKLKYADVNQKILLNKVLMLGTKSQTVIGRPVLPNAAVCALVEEQAVGATVIIFKKKRRKNYRRTNFHRQELTTLRIMDIKLDKSLVETAVAA